MITGLTLLFVVAVYAFTAAVCGLCGLFFGFILIVHALDWWNNRRPAETGVVPAGRKRL